MTNPFFMHAMLAFAAAHLKHLLPFSANPTEYRQNALVEAYHLQGASHLFRKELNSPLGLGLQNMDLLSWSPCSWQDSPSFLATAIWSLPRVSSTFLRNRLLQ